MVMGQMRICYIDSDKNCYLIAENGKEFLNKAEGWKDNMIPCNDIDFFESFEVAQEKYEFLDRGNAEFLTKRPLKVKMICEL